MDGKSRAELLDIIQAQQDEIEDLQQEINHLEADREA